MPISMVTNNYPKFMQICKLKSEFLGLDKFSQGVSHIFPVNVSTRRLFYKLFIMHHY